MSKSAFIRTRIEPELKEEVEKIFEKLGLSPTEAIKIFYKQIILNQGLPFEVKIPNAVTRKAIKDSIAGMNQKQFDSAEELFDDLGI